MFTLNSIVPWGRSFDEYRRMFALEKHDLEKRILGCADGPASFNAELTALGGRVTSCDPLYRFSADEIHRRILDTAPEVSEQTRQNADAFLWTDEFPHPDALVRHRMATMDRFLDDYETGRHAGRYIAGELPNLPFHRDTFDLALCSHFLFLYSKHLSQAFHLEALRRLSVVALEVRVFPLLELGAMHSRYIEPAMATLCAEGYRAEIIKVNYEFRRGGNQMLRITR